MARHAFDALIPLSVESDARRQIIFDFFEVLAAIAARAKTNGLGGRKLSRLAGWWAFAHSDDAKGFEGGYRSWMTYELKISTPTRFRADKIFYVSAADATSHLFFAYLRSLAPDPSRGLTGINTLPRSLEALLSQTEYPPEAPTLMFNTTTKVVMIVDSVSPTPFALLRRAKQFEYRNDDDALQRFSECDDPVRLLTDECQRVLNCISSTNQSEAVATTPGVKTPDPSWAQFEDFGFGNFANGETAEHGLARTTTEDLTSLRSAANSRADASGRPTTPSWGDFLSSGFAKEGANGSAGNFLLPPDKALPPLGERSLSSQSFGRNGDDTQEPGELASITRVDLDETFWWVWMTSLAGEEPVERKKVFGRCAMVETGIPGSRWLIMEEQVKGASPGQDEGVYIVEKKGRFSFTRRGKLGRRKSSTKTVASTNQARNVDQNNAVPVKKTNVTLEQQQRVLAAAVELAQQGAEPQGPRRRSRTDESVSQKTNSIMSLQPMLVTEAGPAMKWAKEFDKEALRARYLGDPDAGKGNTVNLTSSNEAYPSNISRETSDRELPQLPSEQRNDASNNESPLPDIPKDEVASNPAEPTEPETFPVGMLDEKFPSTANDVGQHPAYRKPEQTSAETTELNSVAAARRAWESREALPAALPMTVEKKPVSRKLYKQQPTKSGFKKLFGRRQSENKTQAVLAPAPAPPSESYHTQSSSNEISRQVSATSETPPIMHQPSSYQEESAPAPAVMPVEQPEAVATPEPVIEKETTPQLSRGNTYDREQPALEPDSSRLNQGPMQDVPAFVPDTTEAESPDITPPAVVQQQPRPIDSPAPSPLPPTPPSQIEEQKVPSISVEPEQAIAPVQDRWAQIRKNAAERANGRNATTINSGDNKTVQDNLRISQSSRTDEGYTSEEETIESRVARIKARVAELTGNGDVQAPGVAPGR